MSERKFKEFWVRTMTRNNISWYPKGVYPDGAEDMPAHGCIHVIEYSALDAWREQCRMLEEAMQPYNNDWSPDLKKALSKHAKFKQEVED